MHALVESLPARPRQHPRGIASSTARSKQAHRHGSTEVCCVHEADPTRRMAQKTATRQRPTANYPGVPHRVLLERADRLIQRLHTARSSDSLHQEWPIAAHARADQTATAAGAGTHLTLRVRQVDSHRAQHIAPRVRNSSREIPAEATRRRAERLRGRPRTPNYFPHHMIGRAELSPTHDWPCRVPIRAPLNLGHKRGAPPHAVQQPAVHKHVLRPDGACERVIIL